MTCQCHEIISYSSAVIGNRVRSYVNKYNACLDEIVYVVDLKITFYDLELYQLAGAFFNEIVPLFKINDCVLFICVFYYFASTLHVRPTLQWRCQLGFHLLVS